MVYRFIFMFFIVLFQTKISAQIDIETSISKHISYADSLKTFDPLLYEKELLMALDKANDFQLDTIALKIIHDLVTHYGLNKSGGKTVYLCNKYLKSPNYYTTQLKTYKSILLIWYQAESALANYNKAMQIILDYDKMIVDYNLDKNKYPSPKIFIGEIHALKRDYDKAIYNFKIALDELPESMKFYNGFLNYMLSKTYFKMDSLKLGAVHFEAYTKALKIHEQSVDFRIRHFSQMPDELMGYFSEEKLLEIYHLSEDVWIRNDIGFVLASFYEKQGNYKQSVGFWKNGLLDLNRYHQYNLFPLKKIYDNYLQLNQADSAKIYIDHFIHANNQIYDIEKNKQFAELNEKYRTAQKDMEINKQKSAKRNIIYFSLICFTLLMAGTILILSRLKTKGLVAEQALTLQNQKIADLEKEKLIVSMTASLEGQEAERIRIAKDLHDGLGGLLSSIKIRFSNFENEIKSENSKMLMHNAHAMIDEACEEVRKISHNLMPGALRLEGLDAAIENFTSELSEIHHIKFVTEFVNYKNSLDEEREILIYRIIQEACNNIVKYAQAKNVTIQLMESESDYHLFVEDDGVGFDTSITSEGLGLRSMMSRARQLKGAFDIVSKQDEGTTITITIPK